MLFLPSWESCIFGRRAFLYAHVGPFKTLSPAERSKPTQHLGPKPKRHLKKIKCEFNPGSDVMCIYIHDVYIHYPVEMM